MLETIKLQQKQEELEKSLKTNQINKFNINIWDDFFEDGFCSTEEIQTSYNYVDIKNISSIEMKKMLEILFDEENSVLKNSNHLKNVDIEIIIKRTY